MADEQPLMMSLQWHKLAALTMHKNGVKEIVLSQEDISNFQQSQFRNLVVQEKEDGLHVSLVDDNTFRQRREAVEVNGP